MLEGDILERAMYLAIDGPHVQAITVLNEAQPKIYETVPWQFEVPRVLVVHRLAVDPICQGQGLASRLMAFAEDLAARHGYEAIRLDAFADNVAACRVYEKRGYRKAGACGFRKGLFYGPASAL